MNTMRAARHVGKIVLAVPRPLRDDGTYLITGGLGALGRRVAGWLAEHGIRHIALTDLHEADEGSEAAQALRRLSDGGCEVRVIPGDVSDADSVGRILDEISEHMPALRGVVHAAGVLDDGVLVQKDWDWFEQVARPKALGAWHIHQQAARRGIEPDAFVFFSSAASLLGNPAQGNYAAANAFLDGMAALRGRAGNAATNVNWGPWADGGMAVDGDLQARLEATGVGLLRSEQALAALGSLLRQGSNQAAVLRMNWNRLAQSSPERITRMVEGLVRRKAREAGPSELVERLRNTEPAKRHSRLVKHMQAELKRALKLAELPEAHRGFFDLGMDSLMAVELGKALQRQLGREFRLSTTLAFDYPTPDALARYLLEDVLRLSADAAPAGKSEDQAAAEVDALADDEVSAALEDELQDLLEEEPHA
jgi:NAD(P)-dependent dehydrogenase (short-subunit alcohol dehydrogenase family)/acyl carrier protein